MSYLLFANAKWYPAGGWNDLVGIYETPDEARIAGAEMERISSRDFALEQKDYGPDHVAITWWHVVELHPAVEPRIILSRVGEARSVPDADPVLEWEDS